MKTLIDIDKLLKALEAQGTDLSDDENYYNDDTLEGYSRWLLNRVIDGLPHEMSAMEYLRARERMCAERLANWGCNGCLLLQCKGCDCETIEANRPDEAVAIIERWVEEHPEGSEVK